MIEVEEWYVYVKVLVQIEREEWRLVGLGRSSIVEGIDVEIGEESCNLVIVVVNCK